MKFGLNTTYVSDEYLDGTSHTVIEMTRGQARRILDLRRQAITFMETVVEGRARLRVPFSGFIWFFDDNDDALDALKPLREGQSFVRLPDDFQIPDDCARCRIELESLSYHHDGELWLDATARGSGDYLETQIPVEVFEQAAQ